MIAVAFLVTFTHVGSAQRHRATATGFDSLDRPVGVDSLQDVTTVEAVIAVLARSRVSGGVAEVDQCSSGTTVAPAKHSFDFTGLTVRQALDIIVADDPQYNLRFRHNIVNLLPASGAPGLLTLKLRHFETAPDQLIVEIGTKLLDTPEAKRVIARHGMSKTDRTELIIGGGDIRMGRKLSLNNSSILDILNEAAASYKYPAVWRYTETRGACYKTYYLDWPVH